MPKILRKLDRGKKNIKSWGSLAISTLQSDGADRSAVLVGLGEIDHNNEIKTISSYKLV